MNKTRLLDKAEWGVCIGATLAAIWLHTSFWFHAGGLWRDEVTSVRIGTCVTVGEMWHMLRYESFPALFPAMVRVWSMIGLGGNDLALRSLGLLAGLSLLAAIWINARILRFSPPLISLALLAANLTVLRWGDSLRAYGLGCALILLTFALIWSLINKPSKWRFVGSVICAILSVQCLYQNSFLLLAICLAACFVCFRSQQEKLALLVVGIGAAAAVSLLPYLGTMMASQKSFVVARTGFQSAVVLTTLADALGSPGIWQIPFWVVLGVAGLLRGLIFLPEDTRRRLPGDRDLPLFAAITSGLSILLFLLFIAMARLPTQPWYWLPPMTIVAVCTDAALRDWPNQYRGWRLAIVGLMVFIPFICDLKPVKHRQTSIDLVAQRLSKEARPNDLILVYPWYCGVTFNWYYHGATPWITLPILPDFRVARYDLLREKLAATAPMQPISERIISTLASGGRLWIVGQLPPPLPDETEPPDLPPAPDGPQGWFDVPYTYVWGRQTEHLLGRHRFRAEPVPIDFGAGVNIYENSPLTVVNGIALPTPK